MDKTVLKQVLVGNQHEVKRLHFLTTLFFLFAVNVAASDWMKNLPDNVYLSQLSLPGTHDSGTGNGINPAFMAAFAQCQDITLGQQWAAGVRAFDLRPCVKDDYININHGITATNLRFDDALFQLRDSLQAHPSEFAFVHYHYDNDFDNDRDKYLPLLQELLSRDDLKDFLVPFRRDLTLGDVRGKMLLISRQSYADYPYTGGFIRNWTSALDWDAQTSGSITGMDNDIDSSAPLYMQDYYNVDWTSEGFQKKADAVTQLLEWSTTHKTESPEDVVWVMNYTSAYPGFVSTADGYRENATHSNAAVIDYLSTHEAGPTGVVFMDFCVDESNGKVTRGQELINALVENNYKCLGNASTAISTNTSEAPKRLIGIYSVNGTRLSAPQPGEVNIMRYSDGTVKKMLIRL